MPRHDPDAVRQALARAGLPPAGSSPALLGEGGFHRAWLAPLEGGGEVVVRLRKPPRAGPLEDDLERARSEYAAVERFYRFANERAPGACPERYAAFVDGERAFTVESFMGPSLARLLGTVGPAEATELGERAGRLFARLHAVPSPLPGWTHVTLRDGALTGRKERPRWRGDARRDVARALEALEPFAPRALLRAAARLPEALRPPERFVLTSTDVGPEQLTRPAPGGLGLIDPVPVVGSEARYAAFFLYTYRLLIPSLARAPRFAHHRLHEREDRMRAVAAGYERAYLALRPELDPAQVEAELFRWALADAAHQAGALREGADEEERERLERYLRFLGALPLAGGRRGARASGASRRPAGRGENGGGREGARARAPPALEVRTDAHRRSPPAAPRPAPSGGPSVSVRDIAQMLLLSAAWGVSFLLIKIAGTAFPPVWVALLRMAFGGAFLWIVLFAGRRVLPPRRLLVPLLLVALFNNAIPFTFFAWGELTVSSSLASILNATTPIWSLLIALGLRDADATPRAAIGVALGFLGVMLAVGGGLAHGAATLFGVALIAAASLGYAIATNIAKRALGGLDPIGLATTQLTLAAVMVAPIALAGPQPADVTTGPLVALAILGVIGSGLAYLLYYDLLSRIGPTQVVAVTYLLPIWGLFWGRLAGEPIPPTAVVGVVVVLAGLVLLNAPGRGARAAPAPRSADEA